MKTSFIPTACTLLNVCSGALSVHYSFTGNHHYASAFLLLAIVFDAFDGKLARHFKEVSELGAELDSLCDAISFGLAPFALVMSQFIGNPMVTVIGIFFVACGVYRLARYNVAHSDDGFEGIPITVNGALFPMLYYLQATATFNIICMFLMGIFMVSKIKIPRVL